MQKILTHRLSCGASLVIEPMSGVRSAAIFSLIGAGNAYDPEHEQGRAAMWSELALRGGGDLGSREQADAFDRIGASRSCESGRVTLRLSSTMLGERVCDAARLLADIIVRPRMDDAGVAAAQELALQAIASLADEPQQRAVLAARARHFVSPFNRSGLGEEEAIRAMTAAGLQAGWQRTVLAGGSVIGVAGAVRPDEVIAAFEACLSGWSGASTRPVPSGTAPRGYGHEVDDSNQVQVIVVHDAPAEGDRDRVLERMLVGVLSDGMSSRLFSEVREKRGLCYSVSASYAPEREFGSVSAYVGTTPERAQEALDVLVGELRRVNEPGGAITAAELERTRTGMKSRLIFSGESTGARAGAVASDLYRLGRVRTLGDLAAELDAVTLEQLNAYAARRSLGRLTVQTVGPAPLRPPEGA